jgi:ATP-dependent helicase/DNAse subunit B
MPVSLIVGPPNSGRAGELLARLRAVADREPVLVVPTSQDASRFERDLSRDGRASIGISLRTFRWLFADLAEIYGVAVGPSLSTPERLALVRVAVASTPLRALRRSASRPGFAPALDSLLTELGAALIGPDQLAAAAADLPDGGPETELASLQTTYCALRDRTGRSDETLLAERVLAAVRADPAIWGQRPLFLYGFDDLSVAQRELLVELGGHCEVTVAVNYSDRVALGARAALLAELRDEIGVDELVELSHPEAHSPSNTLVHLDRNLFEGDVERIEPDDGLVLMESAGERGEADAIALEAARLIAAGAEPDQILVTTRHPATDGGLIASVLEENGLPTALEASVPLERTGTGRALLALCRAALPTGTPADVLAHMRCDPTAPPGMVDWLERAVRRGEAETVDAMFASWENPPRHLARLRGATTPGARLGALAVIARNIAEGAHAKRAPLAGAGDDSAPTPVVPLELRAGAAAAELLSELGSIGGLEGVAPPDLADAIAAIEGASVPAWRGPAEGRIRIVSPYKVRGARVRFLFCAGLQDGTFPARSGLDPLLGPERRAALGFPALRRRDPADEERFLFHACVSRPRERLYLSWRSSDESGAALSRSPFVDEVTDLIAAGAEQALTRVRGPERVVPLPTEATTDRARRRAQAALESRPERKPRGVRNQRVLADIAGRDAVSAGSLEGWLGCSYKWFVEHELRPQRLEPTADPLWLGGIVHKTLETLYREHPGDDTIPRPGDVSRWRKRMAEILAEQSDETARGAERRTAIARVEAQLEAFLEEEAASETELRPAAELFEWSFGFGEDHPDPLGLGELRVHGYVDRVDVARDGRGAIVRDYKTSKKVHGVGAFKDRGLLQLPLYMRAVQDILGLEAIGGLYHPLASYRDRRPRGIGIKGDERLDGLDLVRGKDLLEPEDFERELDEAVERAAEAAREMHAGDIRRNPLGGQCPSYCRFQPICRKERALGIEGEDDEDDA